jgi:DNA (cytosine-5)-methyltransferase 1
MASKPLEVVDMFCGAGGTTNGVYDACAELGLAVNMLAINHWDVAVATHSANHPYARHLCESVDNVDPRKQVPGGRLNLLVASPECTHHSLARGGKPMSDQSRASAWHIVRWAEALYIENILVENVREFCFPEYTAVLSKRGIVEIGDLVVGDEVWTHNARWKPVTHISRRRADTVRVIGYGNSIIEPTENHEFYARQYAPKITKSGKYGRHESRLLQPEWVRADRLADKNLESTYTEQNSGYAWATPSELPRYWQRMPKTLGVDTKSPAFFYMIGRWLGDGWIWKRKQRQDLVRICDCKEGAPLLETKLAETGLAWRRSEHTPSVDVFDLSTESSKILIPWLRNNFGQYAPEKTLPAWIFGASTDQRWALIEGYCDADGSEDESGKVSSTSVSRRLAVGIRLLLQSLGVVASIGECQPQTSLLNGKPVEGRWSYCVTWQREITWEKCHRYDLHIWGPVREVKAARKDVEVVDITVADDHSFIADGQVVHNCNWGPLGSNGRPLKSRKGETFQAFIRALESLNYNVEYRVLNAADYGDATTRHRLFVQARKRPRKIAWPVASHHKVDAGQPSLFEQGQPWRGAREIIDWSIPGKSIFGRKKPLAPTTLARIAAGLKKFGGQNAEPFLVVLRNHGSDRSIHEPTGAGRTAKSVDQPLSTVIGENHTYVIEPFVAELRSGMDARSVKEPLSTITTKGGHHGLVEPFLAPFFGERQGQEPRCQSVDSPLPTVTSHGAGGLVEPFLTPLNHGAEDVRVYPLDRPLPTVTSADTVALIEPFIVPLNHGEGDTRSHSIEDPMPTLTSVDAWSVIEPFLAQFNGTGGANSIDKPLGTITAKDRFGLVQTYGLDIRFRMLQPRELANAMSFPETYQFTGPRDMKVKQIGNGVPRRIAKALALSMVAEYQAKAVAAA